MEIIDCRTFNLFCKPLCLFNFVKRSFLSLSRTSLVLFVLQLEVFIVLVTMLPETVTVPLRLLPNLLENRLFMLRPLISSASLVSVVLNLLLSCLRLT